MRGDGYERGKLVVEGLAIQIWKMKVSSHLFVSHCEAWLKNDLSVWGLGCE